MKGRSDLMMDVKIISDSFLVWNRVSNQLKLKIKVKVFFQHYTVNSIAPAPFPLPPPNPPQTLSEPAPTARVFGLSRIIKDYKGL